MIFLFPFEFIFGDILSKLFITLANIPFKVLKLLDRKWPEVTENDRKYKNDRKLLRTAKLAPSHNLLSRNNRRTDTARKGQLLEATGSGPLRPEVAQSDRKWPEVIIKLSFYIHFCSMSSRLSFFLGPERIYNSYFLVDIVIRDIYVGDICSKLPSACIACQYCQQVCQKSGTCRGFQIDAS